MQQGLEDECKQAVILIIDDEPVNLKLLQKTLNSQGYENLELVDDSRTVLERYHAKRPDLILLDINMPHIDGFAVLKQLRELNDPLLPPVVVLTAQHGRDYLLRALNEGARDFVTKPFDRVELLMRVRNLLEAHLAHKMIHNQKDVLDELVRLRTDELQQTRLQVVQRLGRAAEYRDNETGFHILRMSNMSALLAGCMGWDIRQCELMLHASPMHDIGKIGIPDKILLKPGKLDPDEWEIMKTHAEIGAELLSGDESDLLTLARSIALTHHEKWDGSGYPNSLVGENIPLEGRIVAVADVFDALTSERPYKKAWSVAEALSFIKEQSGKHFDPAVVKCLNEVMPELETIRERYPDKESSDVSA